MIQSTVYMKGFFKDFVKGSYVITYPFHMNVYLVSLCV